MVYELDPQGLFVSQQSSSENLSNWTSVDVPQPVYTPRFVGTRDEATGEWFGSWVDDGPAPLSQEQHRAQWKAQREYLVSQIKVTTQAGNTFDGDEVSQGRMARGIIALGAAPDGTTVTWVLADNTTIEASPEELTEALALAGSAQATIWVTEDYSEVLP